MSLEKQVKTPMNEACGASCMGLCLTLLLTFVFLALTFGFLQDKTNFYYQNKKLNYLKFNPLRPPIFHA